MLYLNRLRVDAKEQYDRALMVWSNTAAFSKSKPPEVPAILR